MDVDWIKSPTGRRVLVHWADPRPAWLWSGDGARLLWRNRAARLFGARTKKSGVKLVPNASPIKGQVARLIRLGSMGRSSLSRIQFLAGEKPMSTTCTVTPLELSGGDNSLLIVAVDGIEAALLEAATGSEAAIDGFFPSGAGYLLLDEDGHISGGSTGALAEIASELDADALPELDEGEIELASGTFRVTRFKASPSDASLLLFEPAEHAEHNAPAGAMAEVEVEDLGATSTDEPLLPMGLPPPAIVEPQPEPPESAAVLGEETPRQHSLSTLFDRLAGDAELYMSLDDQDDSGMLDAVSEDFEADAAPLIEPPAPTQEVDDIAAIIDFDEPEDEIAPAPEETAAPRLYKVTGRWFAPAVVAPAVDAVAEALEGLAPAEPPDVATVERVSRYNFEELSRILNDRVGGGEDASQPKPAQDVPTVRRSGPAANQPEGQLVNLAGETFILNRLPLGILVFRDQQVLFANRSITEMIGYNSVEDLRGAGLSSIFPASGGEAQQAGPVNHLVQRNGTLVPVTARLQSISWQGRPALMLSASATEVRTSHEGAVRAFAELLAETRQDGFVELTRNGVVSQASGYARLILADSNDTMIGKALSALIHPMENPALKEFLERPARFAETARPSISLKSTDQRSDITLFAQGQAGVVTGYFGIVRPREVRAVPALEVPGGEVDSAVLARVSRGIRRPLNSIIGFADLIRSAAFGDVGDARYLDYARDIKAAGHEVAALVDELDDYARLKDGRYAPRPADVDLGALLESCILRVRGQASASRVLVRSAISERLPRIRADRASLGQAVLNLLASAIDQTPPGGTVILSAQSGDDGSVIVNVRDSSPAGADPDDRFVVFRDGIGRNGEQLRPVRSSVGLALTRSLLAVNVCSLSVDPVASNGTLFSLVIPPEAVAQGQIAAAD